MEQKSLEVKRGDSKTYTLHFKDEDGAAIDITGYEIRFSVKEKIDDLDAAAKIAKVITSHTDPTAGKTQISLSVSDTNLVGNYIFDVQVKNTLNQVTTLLEGVITFTKDVTQTS